MMRFGSGRLRPHHRTKCARAGLLLSIGIVCAVVQSAHAVSFHIEDGHRSATATFGRSGDNLVVTLVNDSPDDVLVPTDVLCSVFFDLGDPDQGPSPVLTPVSAIVPDGQGALFPGPPPDGWVGDWPTNDVGGEWAYQTGMSGIGTPGDASQGISSSGYGPFGPADTFPPQIDLHKPVSPDGLNYGITSMGDDPATGNTPVTGGVPLIQYSVVFTLSGLPTGFDVETGVSNVWFLYGTDLSGPQYTPIPEPATMAGLVLAVGGVAAYVRRRRRA